jgi:hypothetical protein
MAAVVKSAALLLAVLFAAGACARCAVRGARCAVRGAR